MSEREATPKQCSPKIEAGFHAFRESTRPSRYPQTTPSLSATRADSGSASVCYEVNRSGKLPKSRQGQTTGSPMYPRTGSGSRSLEPWNSTAVGGLQRTASSGELPSAWTALSFRGFVTTLTPLT